MKSFGRFGLLVFVLIFMAVTQSEATNLGSIRVGRLMNQLQTPVCQDGIPSDRPSLSGDLQLEVGQPANIFLNAASDVYWIIFEENLPERRVDGNPLTDSFSKPGSVQVTVYAKDICGQIFEQTFNVQVVPAEINASLSINDGALATNVASVSLQLEALKAKEMYITNDPSCEVGGHWQPYLPSFNWALEKESTQAKVYAMFRNPFFTSACVQDGILFDQTIPEVQFVQTPSLISNSSRAQFVFSARDAVSGIRSFQCSFQNEEYKECTLSEEFILPKPGAYQLRIRAIDNVNNQSEVKSFAWSYELQTPPQPPTVTLTGKPEQVTTVSEARFEFIGQSSAPGELRFRCEIDRRIELDCQSPVVIKDLSIGDHYFSVIALDSRGQASLPVRYKWSLVAEPAHIEDKFVIDRVMDRVDILIVNDNSPSMREEQQKMAQRFSKFISTLSGLDWQLAMITTDVNQSGKSWQDGRLLKFNGTAGAVIINSQTPNLEKVFADTIRRRETGSSNEQGIKALRRALSRPENANFIRPNSHLASVVISDEDEKSTGKNLGADNRPNNLIDFVTQNFGLLNSYTNHSIIFQKAGPSCSQVGSSFVGKTYAQLSDLTQGTVSDVCAPDYSTTLQRIAGDIQNQAFTYRLKCTPAAGSFHVRYIPTLTKPINEELSKEFLKLKPYPPVGTEVIISYDCLTR
jgi:hypothetical protein